MESSTAVATPEPAAPIQAEEPAESIASHAAQFDANRPAPEGDDPAPAGEKPRPHRAKSKLAGPDDVPRINALTGRLRTAEERATRLEQELATLRQAPSAERVTLKPEIAAQAVPEKFAKYPDWSLLPENADKDHDDYLEARENWRDTRAVQTQIAKQTEAQTAAQTRDAQVAKMQAYGGRVSEFVKTHPDFSAKHQAALEELGADAQLPDLLYEAIIQDDNGPAVLYAFFSDPVFRDDMILLSDGKSVTDTSVAQLRRRLNLQLSRPLAAPTGSAATTKPQSWTARPPNPVRTSPTAPGDEPPGDGASISDHAKYFGPKSRR